MQNPGYCGADCARKRWYPLPHPTPLPFPQHKASASQARCSLRMEVAGVGLASGPPFHLLVLFCLEKSLQLRWSPENPWNNKVDAKTNPVPGRASAFLTVPSTSPAVWTPTCAFYLKTSGFYPSLLHLSLRLASYCLTSSQKLENWDVCMMSIRLLILLKGSRKFSDHDKIISASLHV